MRQKVMTLKQGMNNLRSGLTEIENYKIIVQGKVLIIEIKR
jgi:hypothetical protein